MDCPYCGKEMISGYIATDGSNRLGWITKFHKSIIKQVFRTDYETFCKDWSHVKTHRCENCNKMIIDLNDDFNRLDKK